MIEKAGEKELRTKGGGERGENRHIEQGDDVVCGDKGEHLWLDLSFDIEPPQGQDGHWAWFEIVVAGDAQGEAVLRGGDGRGVVLGGMCATIGKGSFCKETKGVEGIIGEGVEFWRRGVWEGRSGWGRGRRGRVGEEGVSRGLGGEICRGWGARDHS